MLVGTLLLIFLVGCQNEEPLKKGTIEELSPFAKSFLGLRSSSGTALSQSQTNTLNNSYAKMNNDLAKAGVNLENGSKGDTTIIDTPQPTCAISHEIKNEDGSVTWITDYGDSCVQVFDGFRYVLWGKSTYTYKDSQTRNGSVFTNKYSNTSIQENLGGKYSSKDFSSYWTSNGKSSYRGEFSYDTLKQIYSGTYHYSDTSSYTYNSEHYSNQGFGNVSYNNEKSIVSTQESLYKSGDDYYHCTVTQPLISDYRCNPFQNQIGAPNDLRPIGGIPVSGHEVIKYRKEGKEGEFEIDYGNGQCDAIFTIIENGKIIEIDQTDFPAPGLVVNSKG